MKYLLILGIIMGTITSDKEMIRPRGGPTKKVKVIK
jgi:hypothetical protein|tara:strand:+ start:432 stop:539 length:108 start_codon:yes stop_codon:yes gene_type:complete